MTHVPWYREQILNNIKLADLIVIVLSFTIQMSLPKAKNSYILTTSLAVLANIASYFDNIHPLSAMRIVRLFEIISNKYFKSIGITNFTEKNNSDHHNYDIVNNNNKNNNNNNNNNNSSSESEVIDLQKKNGSDSLDSNLLSEFLVTILDIINTCVSKNLIQNKNIIYSLVYKKKLFERLNNLEGKYQWTVCLSNIFQVIDHFHLAISSFGDERERTVELVLEKIDKGKKKKKKKI